MNGGSLRGFRGFFGMSFPGFSDSLIQIFKSFLVVLCLFVLAVNGFLKISVRMFLIVFDEFLTSFFRMDAHAFRVAFFAAFYRFLQMLPGFFSMIFGICHGAVAGKTNQHCEQSGWVWYFHGATYTRRIQ